jgi:predicted nucleotidyltransferase
MGAMGEKVKSILAELRRRFEALYGDRLVAMILYGSQARGDAEPGSDIDVLVVLQGPVDSGAEITRTSEIVAGLSLEHGEAISCVFMDEHRFATRNGPLLRNVRKEGVAI